MESVGLLGEVSRDQARASLLSAPLLQDLEEWSQWELVFQPNHGPLKDFIDKHCGASPHQKRVSEINKRKLGVGNAPMINTYHYDYDPM